MRPDDSVLRLKGIGPKTADGLARAGVRTVGDLVLQLPRRWEDRGAAVPVREALTASGSVLLRGTVRCTGSRRVRGRLTISDGSIADETGTLAIRWFNQPWVGDRFAAGVEAYLFGKVRTGRGGRLQVVNPEIRAADAGDEPGGVVPIYGAVGELTGRRLRRAMTQALGCLSAIDDPVPDRLLDRWGLPPLASALADLHHPGRSSAPTADELNDGVSPAQRRLAFDELLAVAGVVVGQRSARREQTAGAIELRPTFRREVETLFPFRFTAAQRRSLNEIVTDIAGACPMARLLQGDVGSGKTAVAIAAVLAAVAGGRQAALMAPTELLAEQLHRSLMAVIEPTGIAGRLLTGSLSAGDADAVRRALAVGEVKVVVGTHALIQSGVAFADLGLVVIDEQHRFGVAQRQDLVDKGAAPHLLVMTATPIPRSLALTLYGDLDVSVIDELPPGRTPVRTEVRDPTARPRIHAFLRRQVTAGGRAFVVCPLIAASDEVAAVSLEEMAPLLAAAVGEDDLAVLHGRMPRDEQEAVASSFRNGETRVLLATTVVEVGLDVPAATVMVVEGADRFGLSQLHQLRGRVGRGHRQSWCILVSGEDPSSQALQRLRVLEDTTDGFEIAEADLRLRGPGELTGLRQWGADAFRFANPVRDLDLVRQTRSVARELAASGELDEIHRRLLQLHPVGDLFTVG